MQFSISDLNLFFTKFFIITVFDNCRLLFLKTRFKFCYSKQKNCAESNFSDLSKSNQHWLDYHVGRLIKFFQPFKSKKFIIELWLKEKLKSLIKIKFSKLLICLSTRRFKHPKWFKTKVWWRLYVQFRNYLLFLKLTAAERVLMLHFHLVITVYRR